MEVGKLLAISVLVHVNLGDPGDTSGSGRRVGTSLLIPAVSPTPMSYHKRFECPLTDARIFREILFRDLVGVYASWESGLMRCPLRLSKVPSASLSALRYES